MNVLHTSAKCNRKHGFLLAALLDEREAADVCMILSLCRVGYVCMCVWGALDSQALQGMCVRDEPSVWLDLGELDVHVTALQMFGLFLFLVSPHVFRTGGIRSH